MFGRATIRLGIGPHSSLFLTTKHRTYGATVTRQSRQELS